MAKRKHTNADSDDEGDVHFKGSAPVMKKNDSRSPRKMAKLTMSKNLDVNVKTPKRMATATATASPLGKGKRREMPSTPKKNLRAEVKRFERVDLVDDDDDEGLVEIVSATHIAAAAPAGLYKGLGTSAQPITLDSEDEDEDERVSEVRVSERNQGRSQTHTQMQTPLSDSRQVGESRHEEPGNEAPTSPSQVIRPRTAAPGNERGMGTLYNINRHGMRVIIDPEDEEMEARMRRGRERDLSGSTEVEPDRQNATGYASSILQAFDLNGPDSVAGETSVKSEKVIEGPQTTNVKGSDKVRHPVDPYNGITIGTTNVEHSISRLSLDPDSHSPAARSDATIHSDKGDSGSVIREISGDLFKEAPSETIMIHSVNAEGHWGAGIAAAFKVLYPNAYRIYKAHCLSPEYNHKLLGSCLLIPPQEDEVRKEAKHWIACLFASRMYGSRKARGEKILENTKTALEDLRDQVEKLRTQSKDRNPGRLYACRFNSGKFGVPWEDSRELVEQVFEDSGETITIVSRPKDEELASERKRRFKETWEGYRLLSGQKDFKRTDAVIAAREIRSMSGS